MSSEAALIVPPPGPKELIEKTATYVARNGVQFEKR